MTIPNSPRKRRAKVKRLFAPAELLPMTGSQEEEEGSNATAEASAIAANAFDQIYLQHRAHRRAFAQWDHLRALNRIATGPRRAVRMIGPSSAGKSTAIKEYMRIDERRRTPGDGVKPILNVALDKACTTKRFFASCLDAYGDEYSEHSVESVLRKRLYECVRAFKTELIFVDEVQHLNFRVSDRSDPTDTLKRMLDDAVVSLVFVGDTTALPLMKRNIQLANRMISPRDINGLDLTRPGDRAIFRSFVLRLDAALVDAGLVARSPHLDEERTLRCLFVISDGLIGRVVNLVRAALDIAVRRGAETIEVYDLSKAARDWAMEQDICTYDPFSEGIPCA